MLDGGLHERLCVRRSGRMILGIDPGLDTGWAILDDGGQLFSCGLGMPPRVIKKCVVFIERPKIYPARSMKGDPNDIVTLAIQVGRYSERYEVMACDVRHVYPRDWKGTVDGDVMVNRIISRLDASESQVLLSALEEIRAKSKHHNVVDAIGLAKHGARVLKLQR